jgi:hypothetical protein
MYSVTTVYVPKNNSSTLSGYIQKGGVIKNTKNKNCIVLPSYYAEMTYDLVSDYMKKHEFNNDDNQFTVSKKEEYKNNKYCKLLSSMISEIVPLKAELVGTYNVQKRLADMCNNDDDSDVIFYTDTQAFTK